MKHRKPKLPFEDAPEGTCMYCGEEVGLTPTGRVSKARWHRSCLRKYRAITRASNVRRNVYKRDSGVCATCGHKSQRKGGENPWEADHIVPLIESDGDIKYWEMDNLQTLCKSCHTNKTSNEATERAEARRSID